MKKILALSMAAVILLTGCTTTIDGEEKNIVKIEQQNYSSSKGTVWETEVQDDIRIIDLVDMDEEEFEEGYASFRVDNGVREFDSLEKGDVITFNYDDNKTIIEITSLEQEENPATEDVENVVEIQPENNLDLEGLVEYKTTPLLGFDLDIDRVTIYTDAEAVDGQILFDDGNRFVIVAHSDNGDYLLMDERIQAPTISTTVYTIGEDLYINILEEGTAHLTYTSFEYKDGVFTGNEVFGQYENVNMIGTM